MRRKAYKRVEKENQEFVEEELFDSQGEKLSLIDNFNDGSSYNKEKSIEFIKDDFEFYKPETDNAENHFKVPARLQRPPPGAVDGIGTMLYGYHCDGGPCPGVQGSVRGTGSST